MPGRIDIKVPRYMMLVDVARDLNAYLLGARNRDNDGDSLGPYLDPHVHGEVKYQLDESNDYWLHADDAAGAGAYLSYRYSERKAACLAALFHAMYE